MIKDEALKYLKVIVEAFGPDDGIELDQKTWANLHTAIKEVLANVATNDTSKEYVDEMQKQRHEQEPVAWRWENGGKHK